MKNQQDSPPINIEVSVANGDPCHEHLIEIMLAFIRCTISVAKKIGVTNPYAAADAVRDNILLAWENTPTWPDDAPLPEQDD